MAEYANFYADVTEFVKYFSVMPRNSSTSIETSARRWLDSTVAVGSGNLSRTGN